jgi:hypothetical protein
VTVAAALADPTAVAYLRKADPVMAPAVSYLFASAYEGQT